MRYQNRSARCTFVRDGETYRTHVSNLEYLNRRLYEIECEPVARPYTDFSHPDDVYLVNADLYRENREIAHRRMFSKDRPYYDELRRIARNIAQTRALDRKTAIATVPKFKDFYWTPATVDNPLNYGHGLRTTLTRAERQNLRKITEELSRPISATMSRSASRSSQREMSAEEKQAICPRCHSQLAPRASQRVQRYQE